MSKFFSFSLYFTSLLPLWLSILFIDFKSYITNTSNRMTEIISIIVIIFTLLVTTLVLYSTLKRKNKNGTVKATLIEIKEEKTIVLEYISSSTLPLLAFDFTVWDSVVLFLLFFCTLGFLYIKNNYFSINIMLELANFKFYNCELKNEDSIILKTKIISNRNLKKHLDEKLILKSINNECKLDLYK